MSLLDFITDDYNILETIRSRKFWIKFEDIIFSPFPQLKCLNCGMYRRNWHCTGITPTYLTAKKILSKFKNHYIIWRETDCTEKIKFYEEKYPNLGKRIPKYAGQLVTAVLKKQLNGDIQIIQQHNINHGLKPHKDFLVFGAGGGCTHCRDCEYMKSPAKKCKKPDISHPSIESWGVDVYQMFKNLNLPIEIPPTKVYMVIGFYCTMV